MDAKKRIDFAMALYDCASLAPNYLPESEARPTLDPVSMERLWWIENSKQYLEKGPWTVADQLPVDISLPLLKNYLETTDSALASASPKAFLRFAHAETLIPLAALLGIPEAAAQTTACDQIAAVWKDYEVSPMAANLIWIVYKHPQTNHVLIQMLLNERPVAFPVKTAQFPFYDWILVRDYYREQIRLREK